MLYDETLASGLSSLIVCLICNPRLPLLSPGLVLLCPKLGCFQIQCEEFVDHSFGCSVSILGWGFQWVARKTLSFVDENTGTFAAAL